MQTKRWICGVLVGMCGVLWGGEVRGETYGCGSDPGFCYRDVGGDGCYDAGTDEASIDGALTDAGGYEATTGSIVCPPSVKKLVGAGESMSWTVPAVNRTLRCCFARPT